MTLSTHSGPTHHGRAERSASSSTDKRGGSTVTILCRMPSGLVLDLYDSEQLKSRFASAMPVISPPRPVASVTLKGARDDPRFHPGSHELLGLAGQTEIDASFWQAWTRQNPDFPALKNGLILAANSPAEATGMLKDQALEPTGLEGLDPKNLPGISAA